MIVLYIPTKFFSDLFLLILIFVGYGGPILIMSLAHHEDNHITRFISFLFVLCIFVFVFSSLGDFIFFDHYNGITGVVTNQQQEAITELIGNVVKGIISIPGATVNLLGQAKNSSADLANRTIHQATTGKTYEEEVDSSSGMGQLGFRFLNLRFGSPNREFFQGDSINSDINFEAKTLDRPIDVTFSCIINPQSGAVVGSLSRSNLIVNSNSEIREGLICRFDPDIFNTVRSNSLFYFAEFNYSTNAYLRRYFVPAGGLKNIEKPLTHYGISGELGSIHTSGPVKITITQDNIIRELSQSNTEFSLGFGIDNNMRGEGAGFIKDISSLTFSIPKGFEVKKRSNGDLECLGDFKEMSQEMCFSTCNLGDEMCLYDCAENNYYYYDLDSLKKIYESREGSVQIIKTPIYASCTLNVRRDQDVLRGSTNLAMRNFRMRVDYTYLTVLSQTFQIVERPGGYVSPNYVPKLIEGIYTRYYDENLDVSQIMTNQAPADDVREIIDGNSAWDINSDWTHLLSGLATFLWRGYDSNYANYNTESFIFKISDAQLKEIPGSIIISDRESELNAMYRYLIYHTQNECKINIGGTEYGDLDCALEKFLGNPNFPKGVVLITKNYKEKQ